MGESFATICTVRREQPEPTKELVERTPGTEQMPRGHTDDVVSGSPEQFFAIDVELPLSRVDPMPVAFILECDAPVGEEKIRMKYLPAVGDQHGRLCDRLWEAGFDKPKAKQRFRRRVRPEADALQCPGPIDRPALRTVAPAPLGKGLETDDRRPFA
jgi:hypothetical protein